MVIRSAKSGCHQVFCSWTVDSHATQRNAVKALVRQFKSNLLLSRVEQNQNKANGFKCLVFALCILPFFFRWRIATGVAVMGFDGRLSWRGTKQRRSQRLLRVARVAVWAREHDFHEILRKSVDYCTAQRFAKGGTSRRRG